jgi:Sec-independent protein translocase protein TatA
MFGIGFSEIAVIALVVLIFIRPDDLPAFFRKAGRLYAQAKKAYDEVAAIKDDFIREMDIAAAVRESAAADPQKEAAAPPEGTATLEEKTDVPETEERTQAAP